MLTPYRNEPVLDMTAEPNRTRMQEALSRFVAEKGFHYPLVIGGKRIDTERRITSVNPARPSEAVGTTASADTELVDRAVHAASAAFPAWSSTPPEVRARYLLKAAAELRRRAFEFSAVLTYEVSKSWTEAYADTAEAIDFLEYYAREMMRLGGLQPVTYWTGEENELHYIPLGVIGVIAPWNFPLAILVGMTSAAVVTGNTVVMKPASQSPVVAARFMELLESVSLPAGVVNYLPGPGSEVGDALTRHPLVRAISFTGSREVGLRIFEGAAITQPEQRWLKRTVLEMGGKDAIIVDEGADPDDVADGVVASAFGFQGQKCSACSRLIIHKSMYDAVIERVVAKASKLVVGDPVVPGTNMGAVIDSVAKQKVSEYIAIGRKEGRVVLEPRVSDDKDGFFVTPGVFADVPADGRLAQEEVFGPILAVIRAESFDDALAIANGTEYGLTGSLYSPSREHLERARKEFHVGNLYLNRKCTGAFVGVQPFGGFNMSGTDSKGGGPDYLPLFMQLKSVAERL